MELQNETKRILKGVNYLPLTGDLDIDAEIYNWFALIYRQFVSPWYLKIDAQGQIAQDSIDILALLIHRIERKFQNDRLASSVQEIVGLLDHHLCDVDAAFKSSDSVEGATARFLGLNYHEAFKRGTRSTRKELENYLVATAAEVVDALLPELPQVAREFLVVLIQQVLSAAIRALSEPWMIHELILKIMNPASPLLYTQASGPVEISRTPTPKRKIARKRVSARKVDAETEKVTVMMASDQPKSNKRPSKRSLVDKIQTLSQLLTTQGKPDNDLSVLMFLQNQIVAKSITLDLCFRALWPLHASLAQLINNILDNSLHSFLDSQRIVWILSTLRRALFPNGFMGPPRVPPKAETQRQLKIEVMSLINKNWDFVSDYTFDSTIINQHLLVSALDYQMEKLIKQSDYD